MANVVDIANYRFHKAMEMVDLKALVFRGYAWDDGSPVYALGEENIQAIVDAGYSDMLLLVVEHWREYYGFK